MTKTEFNQRFKEFCDYVYPGEGDMPPDQEREVKMSFAGGVTTMFHHMREIVDMPAADGTRAITETLRTLEEVRDEITND